MHICPLWFGNIGTAKYITGKLKHSWSAFEIELLIYDNLVLSTVHGFDTGRWFIIADLLMPVFNIGNKIKYSYVRA